LRPVSFKQASPTLPTRPAPPPDANDAGRRKSSYSGTPHTQRSQPLSAQPIVADKLADVD
jgi:hypothetical protein